MEAGTGRELDSSPALLNSIKTASKIALNRFGHLNTVTTVTGEANRVFVQVPQNLGLDQPACLGQTRAKSLAVKAYMVIILSIIVVIICVICVIICDHLRSSEIICVIILVIICMICVVICDHLYDLYDHLCDHL